MPLLKRNLILTNKDKKSSEMALLTIEKYGNNTYNGTIKLYNIETENLVLALKTSTKQIFNKSVHCENNVFTFTFHETLNLDDKLTSVLVKKNNNSIAPLVWYSEESKPNASATQSVQSYVSGLNFNKTSEEFKEHKNTNAQNSNNNSPSITQNTHQQKMQQGSKNVYNSQENLNSVEKQNNIKLTNHEKNYNLYELFDISNENEINKIIDENLVEEGSSSFLKFETNETEQNNSEPEIFYDLISEQIQDLFSKYPNEGNLEKLIPNSKWVKVEYEDSSDPYVLGLIYDEINLKYICYGIEGEFPENPPKDLENYSQWLPLNPDDISLGGYWVMYQDALTGENIKIDIM